MDDLNRLVHIWGYPMTRPLLASLPAFSLAAPAFAGNVMVDPRHLPFASPTKPAILRINADQSR
ncbi:hypothetical protein [Puniceibacterium confluentis]|uniref:hypothetical protein n=1 Tax=Puniceibacterium confluentis TaxID=1958944 RepID=UPI0011B5FC46|nr:hypothetical protein [Puniceibacterium confluentis]